MLMAISNKFGSMVVTTGNKSEMSVGYATLYGDMNGGFNPIKDLYKTEVYRLARWRNAHVPKWGKGPGGMVIPENILTRPPTAELRENQTDQDSLPPYEVLDDILACLVEQEMPLAEIVARGHPPETVNASSACSTSPSTSAARPRPASRSRPATSAATGATPSPTSSARRSARSRRTNHCRFHDLYWKRAASKAPMTENKRKPTICGMKGRRSISIKGTLIALTFYSPWLDLRVEV